MPMALKKGCEEMLWSCGVTPYLLHMGDRMSVRNQVKISSLVKTAKSVFANHRNSKKKKQSLVKPEGTADTGCCWSFCHIDL